MASIPTAKKTVKVAFSSKDDKSSNENTYEYFHPTSHDEPVSINPSNANVRPPPSKQLQDIISLLGNAANVDFASEGDLLFLVDLKWWQLWRAFCDSRGPEPSAINNWDLIDEDGIFIEKENAVDAYRSYRFLLKRGLQDGVHFRLLNQPAWDALLCWYGGGPALPRLVKSNQAASSSYAYTDLYTSLMTNDPTRGTNSRLYVDYWPEHPLSFDEYLSVSASTGASSGQTPPLIRVHSFEFNDCGASVTMGRTMSVDSAMDIDSSYGAANEEDSTRLPQASSHQKRADIHMMTPSTMSVSSQQAPSLLKLDRDAVDAVADSRESLTGAMTSSSKGAPTPRQVDVDSINTCFTCRSVATQRCTKCLAVYYCSVMCQKSHWKYHKKWCKDAAQYNKLPREEFEKRVAVGKRGKVGLLNLGNSCYLSSCLQCLSHILPLTAFFLSNRYENELNENSIDGTGGRLAAQYATLMQNLWFHNEASLAPTDLKNLLGKIREEYAGFQQHDAHEVVELLLDKLHEDLNRVTKKPYVERPEGDGTNDAALAEDSWKKHLLRENSIITDLMGSQMYSQLVCPDCSKVTVCFEYQQTLQVAISRQLSARIIKVIFIPSEIPKIFQNMKFGSSSPMGRATLAGSLTEVMRPVEFAFKVERTQCVSDILTSFIELLEEYSAEAEKFVKEMLRTVQISERADNPVCVDMYSEWFDKPLQLYNTDNIRFLETIGQVFRSKDCITLKRFYGDKESVERVPEETPVAAYNLDPGSGFTAIVIQRIVTGAKPTLPLVIVGFPLVFTVDRSQNCAKFKLDVWKQISHVILSNKSHPPELESVMRMISESVFNVGLSLEFCRLLTVRVVKNSGAPILTDHWKRMYTGSVAHNRPVTVNSKLNPNLVEMLSTKRTAKGIPVRDLEWGSSIPDDKALSLGEFLDLRADTSEVFFSVDWEGLWVRLLNLTEPLATVKHDSCAALESSGSSGSSSAAPSRHTLEESGVITLEKCLREHTQEETLDEDNAWYCSRCKKHQCAKKTVKFWKPTLPKVLIVVLKRFEFRNLRGFVGGMNQRDKIETFVDFPIEGLDLSPFCDGASRNGSSTGASSGSSSKSVIADSSGCLYDLFAVCNHYGRMGFGHYTAYARDWNAETLSDTWHSFDDDVVEEVKDPSSVVSRGAYILMYRRRP